MGFKINSELNNFNDLLIITTQDILGNLRNVFKN